MDGSIFVVIAALLSGVFWSFLLRYSATLSSDVFSNVGDIVRGNWTQSLAND